MKKIFIIGAGGSLGQALILKLNNELNNVIAVDRNFIEKYENVEYITDNFDNIDINNYIDDCDVFFYLLSRLLPFDSNFDDFCRDINSYTRFLNQINDYENKKIIFISSGGAIYGNSDKEYLDEYLPPNPISLYGHQKKMLESLSSSFNSFSSSKVYTLRVSNAYGDYFKLNRNHGLIPKLIYSSINNITVDIWGDGSVTKDYIHNDDIVEACSKLIHYKGDALTMNLSSGKGYSVNQIIEIVNKICMNKLMLNYLPFKSFDIKHNVLSNSLIKKELDWKPKVDIECGIKQLYEKYIN